MDISNLNNFAESLHPTKSNHFLSRSKSIYGGNLAKQKRMANLDSSIDNSILNIKNSIYRRAQNKSLNKSSSNSTFIIDKSQKEVNFSKLSINISEKPIEFSKFKEQMESYMEEYKFDSLPADKRTTKYENLTKKERLLIKNRLNKKNAFSMKDSEYNISVDNDEYLNPLDSLNILKNNNKIYNNIKSSYDIRQRQLINKTINDIQNRQDQILKRIKKSNIPQNKDHKEEIIQHDYIKVPKILPTGDKNYSELSGHYIYSKNCFPEGREQHTFTKDSFDVILFGGIGTNKNNILWKLDPGMKLI